MNVSKKVLPAETGIGMRVWRARVRLTGVNIVMLLFLNESTT